MSSHSERSTNPRVSSILMSRAKDTIFLFFTAPAICGMHKIDLSVPFFSISYIPSQQCTQGPERVKGLYAFRSLLDSGARITLGSDFPVESMNPLSGFYAAITRLAPDGTSPHGPGGWWINSLHLIVNLADAFVRFPEQRLTREEALRGNLSWLRCLIPV